MNRQQIVKAITDGACEPKQAIGQGHASPNIALIKYWGKRDEDLHLPANSNLSIGIPDKYVAITISASDEPAVEVNKTLYPSNHVAVTSNTAFLKLFTRGKFACKITAEMNFAVASGLASSSAWYAALVMALDDWFKWQLTHEQLSILARLGSGSACRSIQPGFVTWPRGEREDGMDSFGIPMDASWEGIRLGILTLTDKPKLISSREGMARCVDSSPFFSSWAEHAEIDFQIIQTHIERQAFTEVGLMSERNAIAMHAVCLSANPPIMYFAPETLAVIQKVWQLREQGIEVYFTEDAGANLILLFLAENTAAVAKHFAEMEIVAPFASV